MTPLCLRLFARQKYHLDLNPFVISQICSIQCHTKSGPDAAIIVKLITFGFRTKPAQAL